MTSNGNTTFVSSHTDEVWAVVVRCDGHGKTFSLRGKDIYDKCIVGGKVTLEYVELAEEDGTVRDYRTKRVRP